MNTFSNCLYPDTPKAAIQLQREMASSIITTDQLEALNHIGGMDVSATRFDPEKMVYATCVVLDGKECIDKSHISEKAPMPYIPGLLGFREAPSLFKAFLALKHKPDLIMVDGQGTCHPRGVGIASHIGLLLDIPTIGVAKTILIGKPKDLLGKKRGSKTPLFHKDKIVAMLVRTKDGCNPLIVSPGHKISLETSIELVLEHARGYRLPEPTRQAHLASNAFRQDALK